jgi:hypothetical protein
VDPGYPGRIELGRLDRWIRRAMATEATPESVLLAGCLVVMEVLREAPDWAPLELAVERLLVSAAAMRQ